MGLEEFVMLERVKIRTGMYDCHGRTFDGKTVPLDKYEPFQPGQLDLFEFHTKDMQPVQLYRLKPEYRTGECEHHVCSELGMQQGFGSVPSFMMGNCVCCDTTRSMSGYESMDDLFCDGKKVYVR